MNKLRLALLAALSLWEFPTFAADSTVTAMPAAGALTGPELFYCIQGGVDSKCTATQVQTFAGPAGANLTLQYNNAGVLGGMSGTSWDNTNRSLTITGATLTGASSPVISLSQTWNNVATSFTGQLIDITSTLSSATSYPLRIRVNAADIFTVRKDGVLTTTNSIAATAGDMFLTTGMYRFGASGGTNIGSNGNARIRFGLADAAVPVAQSLEIQNVVAGASNTAGVLWTNKGSAGTGTGVGGNIKWQVALAGGSGTAQNAFTDALTLDASAAVPRITAGGPITVKGYAIASLPTGVVGDRAYVTDQLTACPVLGGTFTNGGNVVCSAFFDGTTWNHQ